MSRTRSEMIGMTSCKFPMVWNTSYYGVQVVRCVRRLRRYHKSSKTTKYALRAVACVSTCMASVVQRPGRSPNCIEGSILCFSARWERSAATSVDRSLPNVSNRLMGLVMCWLGLAWKPVALAWLWVALASRILRPSHRCRLWPGFGLAWPEPWLMMWQWQSYVLRGDQPRAPKKY